MEGVTLNKVHVFYVGDSEIADVNNWTDLVNAGLEHTDVNGKYGYVTHAPNTSWALLDEIQPKVNGDYVLRVQYTVEGETEERILSKRFFLEKGPVVEVVDGKINVDTRNEYTLNMITVFYVGDKTLTNPNEWNNLVKASANIEGSPYGATGYKMLQNAEAIANEEITVSGNYILRVSYNTGAGDTYYMTVEYTK